MFGKGENLVATDYQMVRHPDIHQAQCLYQTFRDKAVCLAGCDFTGRVIVCQHHSSGIVIQGAFNHFPGMDFRAVDGAGEEGFTGNQLILVIQIPTKVDTGRYKTAWSDKVVFPGHKCFPSLIRQRSISPLCAIPFCMMKRFSCLFADH